MKLDNLSIRVLSLAVGVGLLVTSTVYAEYDPNARKDQYAAQTTQRLTKELGLSSDQAAKIQNILSQNVHSTPDQTPEQRKQQWQSVQNQMFSVFTEQQRATYQKIETEKQNRVQQAQNPGTPGFKKRRHHGVSSSGQTGAPAQPSAGMGGGQSY